jgi:hypothetical protein
MYKRYVNSNWGKPEPNGHGIPTITEFERVARELNLQPDQYIRSTQLREWAKRKQNTTFIPERLLREWGFED